MESISTQLKDMVEENRVFKSVKLLKCILGLNVIESNVFSYILKNNDVTTMELTDVFDKDRSSIQRALIKLNDIGVIEKRSVSLKKHSEKDGKVKTNKRGYLYLYGATNLDVIKQQLRELLEKWYKRMSGYIDNIDSIFDCYEKNGELC